MKFAVVFAALFAVALAAPLDQSKDAQIIAYNNDNIGVEGYNWNVETSDGKIASEQGQLKNIGSEDEAIVVKGQYSYVGDDGVTYSVSYVADENGFQPQGAHLPVAPTA